VGLQVAPMLVQQLTRERTEAAMLETQVQTAATLVAEILAVATLASSLSP
jgi:hypothetical protein